MAGALEAASSELGPIEVLNYSPVPNGDFMRSVVATTMGDITAATESSILGPVTAVQQVLPELGELGRGTIMLVNGSSAALPNANVAGVSIAFAGESALGPRVAGRAVADNSHPVGIVPYHCGNWQRLNLKWQAR